MFGFSTPLALLLLALALIPLFRHGQTTVPYSSTAMLPDDPLSTALDWLLRLLIVACISALVFGIAGFHRSAESVEKIGQGAQMVLLLDSSGSMDRPFVGNKGRSRVPYWGTYDSKGQVARKILAKFVAQREQDMFAMFAFSRNPIAVVPLTQKQAVVQAAIKAGSFERGLGTTDLASGLIRAFSFFRNRPFAGSRIVMLVSDGAAVLTIPMQDQIKFLMEKYRVSLYWIYLRTKNSPGLHTEMHSSLAHNIAPEQIVHKFFSDSGLPYRAFSAEDPKALESAVAEIDKLQNLPLQYTDIIPRRDLSQQCYGFALACLLLILLAKLSEVTRWR